MAGTIRAYPTWKSGPSSAREVTFSSLGGDKVGLDVVAAVDASDVATITPVPVSIATQVLAAANPLRKWIRLYNASTQVCYVSFVATASAAAFTQRFAPNASDRFSDHRGVISAIWAGPDAGGFMMVTEG